MVEHADEFHVLQVSRGWKCWRCLARKTKLRTGYNGRRTFARCSQQFQTEHNEHIFAGNARCFICIRYHSVPNLTIDATSSSPTRNDPFCHHYSCNFPRKVFFRQWQTDNINNPDLLSLSSSPFHSFLESFSPCLPRISRNWISE